MLKKIVLLAVTVLLFACGCSRQTLEVPAVTGDFEVAALKVGKADAIVLKTAEKCILIDCGEEDDGEKIAEYLNEKGVSYIDCVFITHFDKDHVGGFCELSEMLEIGKVISPNYEGSGKAYEKYLEALYARGIEEIRLSEDYSEIADDVLLYVSAPEKNLYAGDNDHSLVVSAVHGENTFLFAGDAEEARLSEIMASDMGHNYDFLKVPHHGRFNKMTEKFIGTVKPRYAVICDSEKNPAEAETVAALKNVGSEIYSTAEENAEFISDGKEISKTHKN